MEVIAVVERVPHVLKLVILIAEEGDDGAFCVVVTGICVVGLGTATLLPICMSFGKEWGPLFSTKGAANVAVVDEVLMASPVAKEATTGANPILEVATGPISSPACLLVGP